MKEEVSVGAIVVNSDGKYLVLKRAPPHYTGVWEFPRGHKKAGESDMDTLKREIWEEAGIRDYNIVKGFVRKNFHTHKDGTKHWIIHYLATVDHPNIRLSEEHCEFDWRDLDGAKSRIHEHHDDVQKHFASILEEADTALKAKDRPSKD